MEEKKILIYNAVLDIVKEQGVLSKIKIADIAKRANMGKGTVYEYFKSKDEIISGSIIHLMECSVKEILNYDKEEDTNFEMSLVNLIRRILIGQSKNCNIHDLLMSQNIGSILSVEMKEQIKEKMVQMKSEFAKVFDNILSKGIEEGIIPKNPDIFNIMVAKGTIMATTREFSFKNKNNINENEDEFVSKLYKVIVKILS